MKYFPTLAIGVCTTLSLVACGEQKGLDQRSNKSSGSTDQASSIGSDHAQAAAPAGEASSTPAQAQAHSGNGQGQTPGQLNATQMNALLLKLPSFSKPTASKADTQAASAPAATPAPAAAVDMNAQVSKAIQDAFTKKLAANPGAMTQAQADLLTKQLTTFVSASASKDASASASAWNTVSATLNSIKTSKHQSGLSLDVTVNNSVASKPATTTAVGGLYGGTGLVTDVLGFLGGGNTIVDTTAGAVGYRGYGVLGVAGGLVGGLVGTVVNTLAGVLGVALELVDSVLTLNVAGVVGAAVDLVGVVVDFVI